LPRFCSFFTITVQFARANEIYVSTFIVHAWLVWSSVLFHQQHDW
jgi:hypothetical protein